ncbi:sigma-70 family RNA polymerase sigma factor [Paenibacillus sp. GSMTC-2017]|uniref:sigma-70 family RNA polymerase sigma factor n=1 Tax=Paenibacillus sp. GSMTC-2017 TaxID=2794350 RepID=UPI0018D9E11F|nr:sigma-70 family RNA polymerase sigma factor [Paenibacillus sp. GSMTC-2017]MBH5317576.1 sigma-70 family RNA polymerase sigma factor [Paenibacillus sp. GSMTC-2017]
MTEHREVTIQFEAYRNHLQGVAYRMLGSLTEAEDAVQETWIRFNRSDTSQVENIGGWLTTVTARICLDMLRSHKSRREEQMGEHVPEQIMKSEYGGDPEHEALLADSVGFALLVVLGNLNPAERIAFVLHDIFAIPFVEIAPIVDRSEAATRKLASRARQRVQGVDSVPKVELARQQELVNAFLAASRAGDFNALLAVLDPNVVLKDDRNDSLVGSNGLIQGANAVAKQVAGRAKLARPALINGSVGIIVAPQGHLLFVLALTITNGKIAEFDLISDPTRLQQVDIAILGND